MEVALSGRIGNDYGRQWCSVFAGGSSHDALCGSVHSLVKIVFRARVDGGSSSRLCYLIWRSATSAKESVKHKLSVKQGSSMRCYFVDGE